MRIGNFHFGFVNDHSIAIREVVLNPALEAFKDFESISQILAKIQGGLESVNVYANKGNGLFGLQESAVQRFLKENAFSVYLKEMIEGEVFLGVTQEGELFISEQPTPYCVTSAMYTRFGIVQNTLIRHALLHYEKTISADYDVLSHSGFEGIVTPEANSFDGGYADDKVVEKLEKELNDNGLQPGLKKYLVTNQAYKINQPKNELATLDFTNKQKTTFLTLCDKFGCPKELFAIADNSTYENRRLAKVDFYQNTIFPYLGKIVEVINKVNFDITGKEDIFYIAKNEVAEVAYEERNAKIAARQGVDALVKLLEKGVMTVEEVRENIGEFFYLNDERK